MSNSSFRLLAQTSAAKGVRGIELLPSPHQDLVVVENNPEEGTQTVFHAHFVEREPGVKEDILGYIIRGYADLERS